MCTLNYDLEEEHKNDSFYVLLQLVEALIHYYQYQIDQSKKINTFFFYCCVICPSSEAYIQK